MAEAIQEHITSINSMFNVEVYNTSMKWTRWVKRLEVAFKVFCTTDDIKTYYLLHYMGSESYDTLCNKVAPALPEEMEYEQIVQLMDKYYNPAPLEIAETFRFHSRKQQDGETIQEYLHGLQKLAINCNFGSFLKTALRNQFVYGLSSKRIQSRLLETRNLDLDKAVEISTGMEMSEKDAHQLQLQLQRGATVNAIDSKTRFNNNSKVNFNYKDNHVETTRNSPNYRFSNLNRRGVTNTNLKCYRCGSDKHLADKCTTRNLYCNFCKLKGHLQKVCTKARSVQGKSSHSINEIEEILQIRSSGNTELRDKFFIDICVHNQMIDFEIDSGSPVTIINYTKFLECFQDFEILPTQLKLISYCNQSLKVLGYVKVDVKYNDFKGHLGPVV